MEIHHPNVLPFFKSSQNDRRYHFWKRCPKSKELYDDAIFEQKLDYIHQNPVKAGLCNFAEEYQYSSAKHFSSVDLNDEILTHYR